MLTLTCVVGGCFQDPKGDLTEDVHPVSTGGADGLGDAGGPQIG